jgi:hypothetical protein
MRALLFLLMVGVAAAQQSTYEIRGVVLDKATAQPVSAEVLVIKVLERGTNSVGLPEGMVYETPSLELKTNASGEFIFESKEPGEFEVVASGPNHLTARDVIALTAADRKGQMRFLLERKGAVSGRVIDSESDKPLTGVPVTVLASTLLGAANGSIENDQISTAGDGTFHFQGFEQRPWVVAIQPRLWDEPLLKPRQDVTAEEAQATDEDYELSYWPGGGRSLVGVLPAPYIAGQTTDLGTIRLRKTIYRRALIHVPPEYCGSSQLYQGELRRGNNVPDFEFPVFCGRDLLLRGLIPGEQYRLQIHPKKQAPQEVRTATMSFVVGDKNPELTAILKLGADIEGRIKYADGSDAKPAGIPLALQNEFQVAETKADAEGRFRFVNVPLGDVTLHLGGKIASAVSLNGREIGGLIPFFEWTGQGSLEVTLDDRPAMAVGDVTDGTKSVARAVVFLVRWPVPAGPHGVEVSSTKTDADGKGRYQTPSLPAGEYRVLAVPPAPAEALQDPTVLQRLLPRAEKATLSRGATQNLNLRVIDPTR